MLALALMVGGGFGNLIDRIVNDGAVVDFLNVGIGPVRTGIFNVADMAILLGAAMRALRVARPRVRGEPREWRFDLTSSALYWGVNRSERRRGMEQANRSERIDRGAYASVAEFYPFYLSQHESRANRLLHFIGTTCVIVLTAAAVVRANYWLLLAVPVAGYGFAWIGHFAFEKNKPATFKYPFYSLACDFVMYKDMWIGRIKF